MESAWKVQSWRARGARRATGRDGLGGGRVGLHGGELLFERFHSLDEPVGQGVAQLVDRDRRGRV